MVVNKYDYLLKRVEYPRERGYRMEPSILPDWIYVTITEKNDSKYLIVHSRIHVNKEVRINPSYSTSYSDRDILQDLSGKITGIFL